MPFLRKLVVLFILAISTGMTYSYHTVGNKILEANGTPLTLQGVNYAGFQSGNGIFADL